MSGVSPEFKIYPPTGPGPLISFDSDEESFVVLGKSLGSEVEYKSAEPEAQIGGKNIEEAKKVIEEEINNLTISVGEKTKSNVTNPFEDLGQFSQASGFSQTDSGSRNPINPSLPVPSIPKEVNISNQSNSFVEKMSSTDLSNTPLLNSTGNIKASVLKGESNSVSGSGKSLDISSLSVEDLQKSISDMVVENIQLRNTLEQDNVKMRDQCRRIVEWQNEVKKVHDAYKTKLFEASEIIDKLTKEKNDVKNELTALQEELNNSRTKLTEIQVVQTDVMQSRSAAYVRVNELNTENEMLKKTIEQLQAEVKNNDEIFALQTQLEVYKNDFEAERQAKETIRDEKEKLIEDLQNLQRRNQQLQERLEAISDKDFVMYPPVNDRERIRRGAGQSSENRLPCPKCRSCFATIDQLQYHCNTCID